MAFTTINGIRIHYEIQGAGAPLLMFAPGQSLACNRKPRKIEMYKRRTGD